MSELFTLPNLGTLLMLIMLQAVLGFDNLLYISLESKRAPEADQSRVRTIGIAIAIVLRILLLIILVNLLPFFQNVFVQVDNPMMYAQVNAHSLIVLFGGIFIIYTAIKEIWHMLTLDLLDEHGGDEKSSVGKVIGLIVFMNVIFSFDSILSAMALAKTPGSAEFTFAQIVIMTTAIIISGILMILLANKVSSFLQKNRMYEVLGLFVLFIVGIMLVTEGAHLAHLSFFENPIHAMSKTTFYFIIFILVIIDLVQGKYQKNLNAKRSEGITDESSNTSI
jgi:predicted tellurium resistance membrane protein TerC